MVLAAPLLTLAYKRDCAREIKTGKYLLKDIIVMSQKSSYANVVCYIISDVK